MKPFSPKSCKAQAAQRLSCADPKRLGTIHSAVTVGAGILVALVALVTGRMIENTGGLSDIGLRTALGTVQQAVALAVQLLLPFWTAGITFCAIRLARGQAVGPKDLLGGMKRWGVLLRLYLFKSLLLTSAIYTIMQLAVMLVMLTPFAEPMLASMDSLMGQSMTLDPTTLTDQLAADLIKTMLPVYIAALPLLAAVLVFFHYQFRLATYRVLDEDRPGAIRAMFQSCRLIHRYRFRLFRLDLSFWWYYLLQALLALISMADVVLEALNVPLPMEGDLFYLVTYLVYGIGTVALHRYCLVRVETAYACFYTHRNCRGDH